MPIIPLFVKHIGQELNQNCKHLRIIQLLAPQISGHSSRWIPSFHSEAHLEWEEPNALCKIPESFQRSKYGWDISANLPALNHFGLMQDIYLRSSMYKCQKDALTSLGLLMSFYLSMRIIQSCHLLIIPWKLSYHSWIHTPFTINSITLGYSLDFLSSNMPNLWSSHSVHATPKLREFYCLDS